MKLRLTLKSPDSIWESITRAIDQDSSGKTRDELREEFDEAARPWVKYGEYVTIEIDTESKTAIVIPAK